MAPTEDKPKALKDWFDRDAVRAIADQVAAASTAFERDVFERRAMRGLTRLEFGGRVQQIADALRASLPDDVPRALEILEDSLPPILPTTEEVTGGYRQWPIGQFIADHGLPHLEASFSAMIALTQRFSSEFAVRPFVERRAEETFARLLQLTEHESAHVRRWCSEGTRPRLPWGKKLHALVADPSPIWPILEALKDDPERYVQRSVANNLGDIAKDHRAAVVSRCAEWATPPCSEDRAWLVRHALRVPIKDGDPGALAIVGFSAPRRLEASFAVSPARVALGGEVRLVARLATTARQAQPLLVDYVVHYPRKRGETSPKVFKWTTLELPARGEITLEKRHAMRTTTIRALYPGLHRVELQVNGRRVAEVGFELSV
ncbi:MAG: DNA alkylation repair protein [Polyangiaceae bacterium]